MAVSYTYNTAQANFLEVFTASSGGTVFSANITASTAFDYFGDSAVVDDAIYFSRSLNSVLFSDITFNVGTAIVADAITLNWEYYHRVDGWVDIEDLQDDTNGFTTITGSTRVRFPLQWRPQFTTINGVDRGWVRCRISAVTNITEGGANQTTRAQVSDGRVTVSGGETTPVATFETVYDWMASNYPYVSLTRTASGSFDFTKIAINVDGRLESFLEVIEFGQDCQSNASVGNWDFEYLTSGVKKDDRGYDGSVFIINGRGNSSICSLGANSKIYGCVFKRGNTETGTGNYPGYFSIVGDVNDTTFEVAPHSTSFQTSMPNLRMNCGIAIMGGMAEQIDNLYYLCGATSLWYTVPGTNGFTLKNFEYIFTPETTSSLHYFYAYCSRHSDWINFTYINPVNTLNSYNDTYRTYHRTATDSDLETVKFYDESEDTYTDYTSEAADSTPDNVPLGGDVGDIIYMRIADNYSGSIYLERTGATNDYVYEWEYYSTSYGWLAMGASNTHDGTENMSITGYMLGSVYTPAADRIVSTTVDGTDGLWMRLRITTKGTGSPTCTKLRECRITGAGPWSINQKYSMDFTIVDDEATGIEGANVVCTYTGGTEIFSITSNVTGTTTTQNVTSKTFRPSGFLADRSNQCVRETVYPTFNLTVSKEGYQTVEYVDIPLEAKVEWGITLLTAISSKVTTKGNMVLLSNPELGANSQFFEI